MFTIFSFNQFQFIFIINKIMLQPHRRQLLVPSINNHEPEYKPSQTFLTAMRKVQTHNEDLLKQNQILKNQNQILRNENSTLKVAALQSECEKLQYQTHINQILKQHAAMKDKTNKTLLEIDNLKQELLLLKQGNNKYANITPHLSSNQTLVVQQKMNENIELIIQQQLPNEPLNATKNKVTNELQLQNPAIKQSKKNKKKNLSIDLVEFKSNISNQNKLQSKKSSVTNVISFTQKPEDQYKNSIKQSLQFEKQLVSLLHQKECYEKQLITGYKRPSIFQNIEVVNQGIQKIRQKIGKSLKSSKNYFYR